MPHGLIVPNDSSDHTNFERQRKPRAPAVPCGESGEQCAKGTNTVCCPKGSTCTLPMGCPCPVGCCELGAACTGCPPVSAFLDAHGVVMITCLTNEIIYKITRKGEENSPRTLGHPDASTTVDLSSLSEPTSSTQESETIPTPTATSKPAQAALQHGIMQPFTWLSRLISSACVRLAQALPVKVKESRAGGRAFGESLHPGIPTTTKTQPTADQKISSSHGPPHRHGGKAIGGHKISHEHLHRRLPSNNSSKNTRTILPISVSAQQWLTTTTTSISTVTVYSTQAATETITVQTCDLRRRREL